MPNVTDLSISALRHLAAERNIPGRSGMNKPELVAALGGLIETTTEKERENDVAKRAVELATRTTTETAT